MGPCFPDPPSSLCIRSLHTSSEGVTDKAVGVQTLPLNNMCPDRPPYPGPLPSFVGRPTGNGQLNVFEANKRPAQVCGYLGRWPLPLLVVKVCPTQSQLLSPRKRKEQACGLDKGCWPQGPHQPLQWSILSIWVPRALPSVNNHDFPLQDTTIF